MNYNVFRIFADKLVISGFHIGYQIISKKKKSIKSKENIKLHILIIIND